MLESRSLTLCRIDKVLWRGYNRITPHPLYRCNFLDYGRLAVNPTRRFSFRVLTALLFSTIVGCSGGGGQAFAPANLPSAVRAAYVSNTPVDSRIVETNTRFAFDLYHSLYSKDGKNNLFLCPTSLSLALQIVYNGAKGDTKTAMDSALRLNGITPADLNNMNAALQASLISRSGAVELNIANGLWFRADSVLPSFVTTNTDYYGSQLGDMSKIPQSANDWVSKQTNGKITQILPEQDYSGTIAILVNAVYFNGTWTSKFDPTKTVDAPFTLLDGTTKNVKMMHQVANFEFYKGVGFKAVRLPYGEDKRLRMILLLPDTGTTLDSLLPSLTPENWKEWQSHFSIANVTLDLPRFNADYSVALKDTLSEMGMGIAFDATGKANFEGIAQNAYLQFVQHKTFLEVSEEGTKAGGATSIGVGVTSVPEPQTMNLNHPFFCFIQDSVSEAILFMGSIVKP